MLCRLEWVNGGETDFRQLDPFVPCKYALSLVKVFIRSSISLAAPEMSKHMRGPFVAREKSITAKVVFLAEPLV